MLTKKEIISIYENTQKCKPYEGTISDWLESSKHTDILWRNKITEFKMKIKEIDVSNKFVALTYKDVWEELEKGLLK